MVSCDSCSSASAKFRCGACKCNYYCNKTCATNHWKAGHKAECKFIVKHIEDFRAKDDNINKTATKLDDAHRLREECCICLNALVRDSSFILPCKHVLCDECVYQQLNHTRDTTTTCPLCRAPLPRNIIQYMYQVGSEFVQRANRLPSGSPERMALCQSARIQLQKCNELFEICRDIGHYDYEKNHFLMCVFEVDICLSEGLADETIAKATALIDKATELNNVMMKIHLKCQIGRSHILLGEFSQAEKAYSQAYMLCQPSNATEVREILHRLSRCFYETGQYQRSIDFGEGAIKQNRHYDGAYEYVAKSHQALGDLPSAVEVMQRAVAYETPWDVQNMNKVKDMLAEYELELERSRATSAATKDE